MYGLGCMLVESRSFEVSSDNPGLYGFKSIGLTARMVVNLVEFL